MARSEVGPVSSWLGSAFHTQRVPEASVMLVLQPGAARWVRALLLALSKTKKVPGFITPGSLPTPTRMLGMKLGLLT